MSTFPKVSKSEWLAKVEKDLKGKPLSSLDWKSAGLELQPIYSAESEDSSTPLPSHTHSSWQMGSRIFVSKHTAERANKEALDLLNKGANALCFIIEEGFQPSDVSALLDKIQLEWIAIQFDIRIKDRGKFLSQFEEHIKASNLDINKIDLTISSKNSDEFLDSAKVFPRSRIVLISAASDVDQETTQTLGALLHEGNEAIKILRQAEIPASNWNSKVVFQVKTSDHYFLNIAKVRALKLLWARILESWDQEIDEVPFIEAHVTLEGETTDHNYNKIRASSQALSAAVAGVNRMYIYPSDAQTNQTGTVFTNRIALNINHLLLQESHIGAVADPSAGSYFIEHMTNELCESAWTNFQKRLDRK